MGAAPFGGSFRVWTALPTLTRTRQVRSRDMAVTIDHVTLTANTVATVDLTGPGNKVGVCIIDNASAVYFNVSTVGSPAADPTVGGDDIHSVPNAVGAFKVARGTASGATTRVKAISAGTPTICVELLGD